MDPVHAGLFLALRERAALHRRAGTARLGRDMIALTGFIDFHARRTPDREALVFEDLRLGYGALRDNMTAMAGRLAALGLGPGDVVAACLRNSPAFYDLAFAASHIGAIFLPLNYRLAADEVAWILDHAGARHLFADADLDAAAVAAEAAGAPFTALDAETARDSRRLSAGAEAVPAAEARPDDVFRLMYTSGTTDRPKGVQHSYTNFYWKCMDQMAALGGMPDDRLLVVGPLYHVGGFDLPGVDVWRRGGCIVLHREARPRAILEAIEAERVTGAWL
ncbi:MAG: AMP-binding protein, partial [Alphaproteobacteria bacterium]|nr:AMP-binding protein [Alphaproteobacteria bacterium]